MSLKSQKKLLQKKVFEEIIAKNVPSWAKDKNLQIQKVQQTRNRIKANKKQGLHISESNYLKSEI